MSDLPANKNFAQTEALLTRRPNAEGMLQGLGGSQNFLLSTSIYMVEWKLNGPIKLFNGKDFVDSGFTFPATYNWEIFDVSVIGGTMGSGGFVEFNILKSSYGVNVFSTIFSTRPQISYTAGNGVSVHEGDSVAGCVAPVLLSVPFPIAPKDKLKLSVTNMQSGTPKDFAIRCFYRARN